MKWKASPDVPTLGQKKRVTKFAWVPTRVNEWTVWLESYQVNLIWLDDGGWRKPKWKEESRNILVSQPH